MWARFDDEITDHPKLLMAGPLATHLWMMGIVWSCKALTDGWIPDAQVRRLVDFSTVGEVDQSGQLVPVDVMNLVAKLEQFGLWRRVNGGWQIHDFEEYQPSGAKVLSERSELSAKRSAAGKKGAAKRWGWQPDSKPVASAKANPQQTGSNAHSPEPEPEPEEHPGNGSLSLVASSSTAVVARESRPRAADTPQEVREAFDELRSTLPAAAPDPDRFKTPDPINPTKAA